MQKEIIYKRKEGISSRKLGDELMLYDGDSDEVHVLNETGAIVWELLNGKNNINQIEMELIQSFNRILPKEISKDIKEIIQKLRQEKLIKDVSSSQSS